MRRNACRRSYRWAVGLVCLALLFPVDAFPFTYPLQPEEVQEAYALRQSRNREDLANFLNQYEQDFQYPSDHPVAYVTSVEFQTPYEQNFLASMRSAQYDKFKASEDYEASAGAVFVRVVVALKINFSGAALRADAFHVRVSQDAPVDAKKTTSRVLCDPNGFNPVQGGSDACILYTREILLRFDSDQFGLGNVTIKVSLPEGNSLETKFDLNSLK